MSSEYDMSFEDFLNYDFDIANTDNGLFSHNTQGLQNIVDTQMLDFPVGNFNTFEGEALDQSIALAQPDSAPWMGDVAFSQLPPAQDAPLKLDEPGESA